jgi:hypothetical protein
MRQQIRNVTQTVAGFVPVIENGPLTNMLTDRDIATRVFADDRDRVATEVGDVSSGAHVVEKIST